MKCWSLVLPLIAVASPAWALEPAIHRELAEAACAAEQMPSQFCRRVGQQVFETDFHEWEDLSAHAQREHGQDRCSAAEEAAERVSHLGSSMLEAAGAEDFETVAIELGRALHTLQDECAHHGISNEEHAYYSLTDTCTDEDVSPDTKPEAVACADARTRDVMKRVAGALAGASWKDVSVLCRGPSDEDTCANPSLPSPIMACKFLHAHREWDGIDSSWDAEAVGAELVASFDEALHGFGRSRTLCGDDPKAIDPPAPHAQVDDTSAGCKLIDAVCLGKVDDPGMTEEREVGGCAAAPSPGWLGLLALLGFRRRR